VRIAIIGSGVAGLVSAHLLAPHHDVTLFEADGRLGGHAHTHVIADGGETIAIDTGFMVFNNECYPILSGFFEDWGIASRPSDMSFSVADDVADVEWCGTNLRTIFAQRRNLVRPWFWRMLVTIVRFNKAALAHLESDAPDVSLDAFLECGGYPERFRDFYLIPMGASIWSANPATFGDFPARSLFRFLNNHGLLSLGARPQWRTLVGGSARYVAHIAAGLTDVRLASPVTAVERTGAGVAVTSPSGCELFDHVVIATHSDTALAMLRDASPLETEVLGAIRYQDNLATLHADGSLMPTRPQARASWNYRRLPGATVPVLTYDVTRLQGLGGTKRYYVTLNQADVIDPAQVVATMHYAHPVFDGPAMAAQSRWAEVSGVNGVSFAGAYWGYGFHEDGAASAVRVVVTLNAQPYA